MLIEYLQAESNPVSIFNDQGRKFYYNNGILEPLDKELHQTIDIRLLEGLETGHVSASLLHSPSAFVLSIFIVTPLH